MNHLDPTALHVTFIDGAYQTMRGSAINGNIETQCYETIDALIAALEQYPGAIVADMITLRALAAKGITTEHLTRNN